VIPKNVIKPFREGNFTGGLYHSSEAGEFLPKVKGKNILLVGGSYSAEDLALSAIKLGVERVYVSTRSQPGSLSSAIQWTSQWPEDRVELLSSVIPYKVGNDGRSVQFVDSSLEWVDDDDDEGEEIVMEVEDIDLVVLCTGYYSNIDMLAEYLQVRSYEKGYISSQEEFPDFEMPHDDIAELVGDIPLPEEISLESSFVRMNMHHGIASLEYPGLFFLTTEKVTAPILELDVCAWLVAGWLTNYTMFPSEEKVRESNLRQLRTELEISVLRMYIDPDYDSVLQEYEVLSDPETFESASNKYELYPWRNLASMAWEGKYPLPVKDEEGLDDVADTWFKNFILSYKHRTDMVQDKDRRRSFRDADDSHEFISIYSGTAAVPFNELWLDSDIRDYFSPSGSEEYEGEEEEMIGPLGCVTWEEQLGQSTLPSFVLSQ